jgi:MFS family permease
MVGISALFSVIPAFVSELFSARLRYSGISASYTIAAGILGGFSPAIGSGLYAWAQDTWPVALFLVTVGIISLIAISLGRPKPTDAI